MGAWTNIMTTAPCRKQAVHFVRVKQAPLVTTRRECFSSRLCLVVSTIALTSIALLGTRRKIEPPDEGKLLPQGTCSRIKRISDNRLSIRVYVSLNSKCKCNGREDEISQLTWNSSQKGVSIQSATIISLKVKDPMLLENYNQPKYTVGMWYILIHHYSAWCGY